MKGGCCSSWNLLVKIVVTGCECVLFLRKGKNDPEGDSEDIRAATPSRGPGVKAVHPREPWGQGQLQRYPRGCTTTLVGLQGGTLNQREFFSSLKI